MKNIELLAPAGSIESLYAAVQSGADAVYLGGNKFSARAYASNFDEDTMKEAVRYCHLYEVKVYVTINTLIKQDEIVEAIKYAEFLYSIGVDALIVQDTGLIKKLGETLPDFELHASTQMTIHNGEGALFLRELGLKRIVLSRELSLREIENISKDLNIETEIFVHGALCVCYSGQCLMSSMIGGRSGNRGRCAQPCRLPYEILNKNSGETKKGYVLSPKDICTLENLREIINSGAASLKIEGRMKRPEYVAGVVGAYRRAIDYIYSENHTEENFNIEEENKKLLQLFNREGFSKAYMFGNKGREMMAYSYPKNTGILLGKVTQDHEIQLKQNISIKDGIRNGDAGFTVSKILKYGKSVDSASKGEIVKLFPVQYNKEDILYKTYDDKLFSELANEFKNPYGKKISLDLEVKFKVNEHIELTSKFKNFTLKYVGELVQEAVKRPLDKERIYENLTKTGDTPFKFKNINFSEFEQGFISMAAINAARRGILQKIEECMLKKEENTITIQKKELPQKNHEDIPRELIYIRNKEQLKAVVECGFENLAFNPFIEKNELKMEDIQGVNIYLKIPNIIKEEYNYVCDFIEKNINNIEGIITANNGIISKFRNKLRIIGDYKINIFNSEALDFYNRFIDLGCLSLELNKKEISQILSESALNAQMVIYGKTELMISEYCAIGSLFGDKCGSNICNKACKKGDYILKDRMNKEFIIETDNFCRTYIYNNVSINLIPNLEEIKKIGVKHYRIDFLEEGYEDVLKVMRSYATGKWLDDYEGYTRGHFKRGVE